jgi:hypothetical protein
MQYKAFATRTKTDHKEVMVATSHRPIDRQHLGEMLMMHSLEFDETSGVRIEKEAETTEEYWDEQKAFVVVEQP